DSAARTRRAAAWRVAGASAFGSKDCVAQRAFGGLSGNVCVNAHAKFELPATLRRAIECAEKSCLTVSSDEEIPDRGCRDCRRAHARRAHTLQCAPRAGALRDAAR